MKSKVFVIHKAVAGIVFLVLGISLIHFIIVWKDMPQEIGMHFDGEGNFDVYESKYYGFYPYVISTFIILALLVCGRFVKKIGIGLSLDDKGDMLFRNTILFAFDVAMIGMCVFALNWSYSVRHQCRLNIGIMRAIVLLMFVLAFLVVPTLLIIIKQKYSAKNKKTGSHIKLKIGNAVCYSLSVASILFMCVAWEREPASRPTTDPFAIVHFGDLGIDAPKILCIIPIIISFLISIAGSILIKKLYEKKSKAFLSMIDDIRVISCIMCFNRVIIDFEYSFSIRMYLLCIGFCIASVIVYFIKLKRSPR